MMETKKFYGWQLHTEDGVTITDTEAPTATLLRDVVKNTVAMFYAAQEPVEEETAVTVAE